MAVSGNWTAVHATKRYRVGTIKTDPNGNQYIYLKGAANVAANVVVSYNTTSYVAVLLAADAVGLVGIAQAAVLAANWGWFLIYGFGSASSDTVAAAGGLFIDGTAGRVDDQSVAGDFVNGMLATGADATNVLPVQLNFPYVTNTVPA